MKGFHSRIEWATALAQGGDEALQHELQAERASALGLAGRRLERALADLARDPDTDTEDGLNRAGRIAWEFMVMREMAGLRDWPQVVRIYAIPQKVLHRMGAAATIRQKPGG